MSCPGALGGGAERPRSVGECRLSDPLVPLPGAPPITARTLGCAGILVARRHRHHIERQAWQWWLDELAWRRASRAQQRRTPGHDQQALPLPGLLPSRHHRGAHPTRPGGRADFRAALNQLRTTGDADQRAAS